jgi:uncharacterized protein
MGVELRPLGVKCNIQCQYCYQNPQRDAGNVLKRYDIAKMKQRITEENSSFTLFGGEPLMVPERDLEELWAWGLEKFGTNGVQTNGTLINDSHIRMFKAYKVHVGISVDGPGELNDVRWHGTLEATRQSTARTHAAIERLCAEGIPPSLIVTLHRNNATAEKLPAMHDWFRQLAKLGITSARLHMLEVDHPEIQNKYALTVDENVRAMLSFAQLETELNGLRFDIFSDMRNLLQGKDRRVTCIWAACDPYTTRAVRGIEGDGQSSNCGRTNKDGIDFTKASTEGFERYIALYHTPYEHGGCAGCRFFLMCKGQCPGTSLDGDWRNRTEHCTVWMRLFERLEEELLDRGVVPVSISPKRKTIESHFLQAWAAGRTCYMSDSFDRLARGRRDGGVANSSGALHGDAHGDHFDQALSPRGQQRNLAASNLISQARNKVAAS